jgi:3-isopropylmalate/(R)-2-methylmalate dehydratase small subunit
VTDVQRIVQIEGTALPMRGDDIDTDRIMPARYLRAITFEGLEHHLFEDERAGSAAGDRATTPHPFDDPGYLGATILVVNRNFGCGSSREHAPQGLHRAGFRAVIGESFSEIFFGNSLLIGLACVTALPENIAQLLTLIEWQPQTRVRIDLKESICEAGGFRCAIQLPAAARDALITGAWDTTGPLLERYEEVNATAAKLPYVAGFAS